MQSSRSPRTRSPHRKRRGPAGGRPPAFDPVAFKSRNVIEHSFNVHKQWRGIATRYDKLATVYRGAVVLRAITIWLTTADTCPSCAGARPLTVATVRRCPLIGAVHRLRPLHMPGEGVPPG